MSHPYDYDVVVLGGGPGGYVAAIRAAQLGLKTALIEKENLGGVCLNWGCIPTKALIRNADIIRLLGRGKEFGFKFTGLEVDYRVAVKRSRQVANRLVKGVGFLMRKNGIEVIQGFGQLTDPHTLEVEGKRVTAANIILATGARPALLPGVEADGRHLLTYRQAIVQEELPERLIIVGAGPIGMEFAYVFNAYGVQVTVVEMLPHVLPNEDPEVAAVVAKAFRKYGVRLLEGTRTEAIETTDSGVQVRVKHLESGEEETLVGDQVLIAIGVKPNSAGIGLETAGVATDARGWVTVNEVMQTNVPHIYAIGDLNGRLPLAHVASAQGVVAAETIAGAETLPLDDYSNMPRCTYCHPQVASIGLTEAQAREAGYELAVGKFPFQANGKALGLGEREGFVKIIMDAKYHEILGVHMVGPEVTELLPELSLARMLELTPEEIARNVHAHPTLSEAIMEAAHAALGHAIHI
ncbi:MAG TPA: dihydrolipoyl dehydrogenase [Anaerolineae bacterium]|nr:dihydrolipoyl dehydrogenase [Anaerolineae bacterium]